MKAAEVMSKDVVTVNPETTVRAIAELMTKHRISGVPVVDADGKLVGILSETDLLHRAETGTERRRKWWLGALVDADRLAREYAAAHARKAADIMSTRVVSVDADMDLGAVADLLEKRNLKRVPVVRDGRLVGIITRGDLVRALVARQGAAASGAGATGADGVLDAIKLRMQRESWLDASLINMSVENGVVELTGLAASPDQRRALRLLVEDTPGVARVQDNMGVKPSAMHL
ncbi:MAG: CBS domain-containing protein [Hyphomicrobiaceae bacterium]